MKKNTTELIAFALVVLVMLAIMGMATFLSVHTGNYKCMWLLMLMLVTDIHVKVNDDKDDKGED